MGSSQRHEEGQPETSLGQCRWDLAASKAYLVSSYDKTLRWRCFAFKILAWSIGSRLWPHLRITRAALETWGPQSAPQTTASESPGQGPERSQPYFVKVD